MGGRHTCDRRAPPYCPQGAWSETGLVPVGVATGVFSCRGRWSQRPSPRCYRTTTRTRPPLRQVSTSLGAGGEGSRSRRLFRRANGHKPRPRPPRTARATQKRRRTTTARRQHDELSRLLDRVPARRPAAVLLRELPQDRLVPDPTDPKTSCAGPASRSAPRGQHLPLQRLRDPLPRPAMVPRLQPAMHPRRPRWRLPPLRRTHRHQRPVRHEPQPTRTAPRS